MTRGTDAPMFSNCTHHIGQCLTRWAIAVQQLKCFAIVCTNADLEAHRPGVRIGDDAAYLQAIDLAAQHAVFNDRLRPTIANQLLEHGVIAGKQRRRWQ